jgi:hypothetical protein
VTAEGSVAGRSRSWDFDAHIAKPPSIEALGRAIEELGRARR